MSDKINLGFVGCGHITKNVMMPQAMKLGAYHIRALMDVDEQRAAQACEIAGGDYHTTDVDRLLGDPDLDAVVICTLPDTHASLGKAFLDAGKHALIQKPPAITREECRALVKAERNSRAKAMVAYCYRLSPIVQEVRKTIEKPRMIYTRMMVSDVAKSHARYLATPALAGPGPMLELACHNVDMVCWLARSKPVSVFAAGGNLEHPGLDVVDNFTMNIEFENGSVATLINGSCGANGARYKWHAEFFGGGVTAIIDGFRHLTFSGSREEKIDIEYESGIGLDRDMEVFRDVVLGKIESPIPAADGVMATLLMLDAFKSMESGRPVEVELDDVFSLKAKARR